MTICRSTRRSPTRDHHQVRPVNAVAEANGFPLNRSVEIIEILLELIKTKLAAGEDVLVSGFGKFSIKKKRERLSKLDHELLLASDIQKSMLPRSIPRLQDFEFSATMIPAKSVGGDFFDFIPLGGDLLAIAVGDVSDKGIPAALFMAMVRSLLRAEAHPGRSPQKVLRSVNRHLMDMNDKEMFVTILFGVLNSVCPKKTII